MKNDAGPRLFGDALGAPDSLKGSLDRVGRNDLLRVAEDRLTPEAIDEMAKAPDTAEVALMDAQRLIADATASKVLPAVESRGWQHHDWHRPRNNSELLASTFAWRAQ